MRRIHVLHRSVLSDDHTIVPRKDRYRAERHNQAPTISELFCSVRYAA